MFGRFVIIALADSPYGGQSLSKALKKMAVLSQSKGMDSSGLCGHNLDKDQFEVVKAPIPTKELINTKESKQLISWTYLLITCARKGIYPYYKLPLKNR